MPSYKTEVAYLKDVIKGYQLAIANLRYETEDRDEKTLKAVDEMYDIINYQVLSATSEHNRSRGELKENTTFPNSWTQKQLDGEKEIAPDRKKLND